MKVIVYLCVKKSDNRYYPTFRVTKSNPGLDHNEVALKLNLELPDELFKKPTLEATVRVPKEAANPPVITAEVVDNVQDIIKQQTGFSVKLTVVEQDKEDDH